VLSKTFRKMALVAVVAAVLIPALFVLAACGYSERFGEWYKGDTLIGRVTAIRRLPDILIFAEDGQSYKRITPEPGNEIVAVYVEIINQDVSKIAISLEEGSAELDRLDGTAEWKQMNAFARGVTVTEFKEGEQYYDQLMWGSKELIKGYQIQGWSLFEVPKGTKFLRFVWREADTIFMPFKKDD